MGCLFVLFAGAFPRLADIFLWIARPEQFTAPFGGSSACPLAVEAVVAQVLGTPVHGEATAAVPEGMDLCNCCLTPAP